MKTAVIAGGGPAGLTAAFELLSRTDVRPIVYEADKQVGGISKTIVYRGTAWISVATASFPSPTG
jgi:protoporphyrinogen oxidase